MIMLVSAFMCAHMCTQEARLPVSDWPAWAVLAPLKGVNYPALFLAWDIILSLHKAETETGPLKPLRPIVLSPSDKQRQRFTCRRGLKPLHFHSSTSHIHEIANIYDPENANETFFSNSFPPPDCLALHFYPLFPLSSMQHKTLCIYYRVSRAQQIPVMAPTAATSPA